MVCERKIEQIFEMGVCGNVPVLHYSSTARRTLAWITPPGPMQCWKKAGRLHHHHHRRRMRSRFVGREIYDGEAMDEPRHEIGPAKDEE